MKDKIIAYLNNAKFPTWSGCLVALGMTNYDVVKLEIAAAAGDAKAVEDVKMLDWFRIQLEAKMEEWLIYQAKHPDIDGAYVNYENIKFMLKVGNPKKYGGAVYEIGGKPKEKSVQRLLKNESGVELVTNKIS